MYGDLTFQPKINHVSKTLASDFRQDLLSDNMSNPAAKQKFKEKKDRIIRDQQAACTFQPEVFSTKRYEDVPGTLGGANSQQFS